MNFAAVKTALQSRERIDQRGKRALSRATVGRTIDVKLDRGGIRDIEFLVQCLQRVYGGEERWLRSRGTLFALHKLHDKGHINSKDHHNLTKAYEFLRNLEHHLQLRHGQQLHQLPANETELKVLAKCMHVGDATVMLSEGFVAEVQSRMAAVAEVYRRVVYQEQSAELASSGGTDSYEFDGQHAPENFDAQTTLRSAVDVPQMLESVDKAVLSQSARRSLGRYLSSAATGAEGYRAVLSSPQAIGRALEVFDCSEYLTDILVRHPSDIDLLEESAPDDSKAGGAK